MVGSDGQAEASWKVPSPQSVRASGGEVNWEVRSDVNRGAIHATRQTERHLFTLPSARKQSTERRVFTLQYIFLAFLCASL